MSQMSTFTIGLIGEVSSGKSSLINAIAGGFISNVSLQRETFHPEWFKFSNSGSEKNIKIIAKELDKKHKENQSKRLIISELKNSDIYELQRTCNKNKQLPNRIQIPDKFNIIDFPGINDAEDKEDLFLGAIKQHIKKIDLLIYITSADKAFVSKSEIDGFNKIQEIIC